MFIRDIKFKIYWVSKSIPAAKSQNFVDVSWAQKTKCAKFLEFNFLYLNRQGYIDITEQKSTCGCIILIHKSYNEIVDKILFISSKTGQKLNFTFLGEAVSHF